MKRKQLFISTNYKPKLKKNYTYYPNRFPSLKSKLYNTEKKSEDNLNIIKKVKDIRRIINKSDQLYEALHNYQIQQEFQAMEHQQKE